MTALVNQTRRAEQSRVTHSERQQVLLIALYTDLLQKYSELWVMMTGVGNQSQRIIMMKMIVLMKGWTRITEVF
jgi:hypothetical protein